MNEKINNNTTMLPDLRVMQSYNQPFVSVKVCSKCHQEKELSEFVKQTSNLRDGRRNICKKCANERDKKCKEKYREQNKEKLNEYNKIKMRELRKNNPHLYNEREKQSRKKNPERYSKLRKLRREKYKEYEKKYAKSRLGIFLMRKRENIKLLGDSYIKERLRCSGFSGHDIVLNKELIEVKRLIIKTKRLCKTLQN